MTATLTERYIAATTKSLDPAAGADVRAELEASIADAVDARVDQGEAPEAAERAVLTELGDPSVLAARYADRPLYLIGPRFYLTWLRLLKLLLAIVPVCAVAGVVIAETLDDGSVGEVIGSAIGAGVSVALHVAFWLTLVFAVLDRAGADTGLRWEVGQLPEVHDDRAGRSSSIASLVWLAVAAAALLWDHLVGFVSLDGGWIPVLAPGMWPGATVGLLVLVAAEAALVVVTYLLGRWTTPAAVVNTALAVIGASILLSLLARGELINPELVTGLADHGVDQDARRVLGSLTGFGIVAIAVWDVVDGWRRTVRAVGPPAGQAVHKG